MVFNFVDTSKGEKLWWLFVVSYFKQKSTEERRADSVLTS